MASAERGSSRSVMASAERGSSRSVMASAERALFARSSRATLCFAVCKRAKIPRAAHHAFFDKQARRAARPLSTTLQRRDPAPQRSPSPFRGGTALLAGREPRENVPPTHASPEGVIASAERALFTGVPDERRFCACWGDFARSSRATLCFAFAVCTSAVSAERVSLCYIYSR